MKQQEKIITITKKPREVTRVVASDFPGPIMLSYDDAIQGVIQFFINAAKANRGNVITFSPISIVKRLGKEYICVRNLSLVNYILKALSAYELIEFSHVREKRIYYKLHRKNGTIWSIALRNDKESLERLIKYIMQQFDKLHEKKQ